MKENLWNRHLTRRVAWGKVISISDPQFTHLNNKTNFEQHLHTFCKDKTR